MSGRRRSALSGNKADKTPPVLKVGKSETKPKRSRKAKSEKTGESHKVLGTHFRSTGRKMIEWVRSEINIDSAKLSLKIAPDKDYRPDPFRRASEMAKGGKVPAKTFNQMYRADWSNMDELVSTSSIRELVFGALEEKNKSKLTKDQVDYVNEVFDQISRVRLPTVIVGYALAGGKVMQHPTSPGKGYFADATKTASEHSQHDLARKRAVWAAINEEMKTPETSFESVGKAAIKAAIGYTLNEMAAPITAEDVQPYSMKANEDVNKLIDTVKVREQMKAIFVSVGGIQEPDNPLESYESKLKRPWGDRPGKLKRTVSALRFDEGAPREVDIKSGVQLVANAPPEAVPPSVMGDLMNA